MVYPTNVIDEQWELIKLFIVTKQHMGRSREVDFRQIMNALLYKEHTGCQWRMFRTIFTIAFIRKKWRGCETFQQVTALFERDLSTTSFKFDRLHVYFV